MVDFELARPIFTPLLSLNSGLVPYDLALWHRQLPLLRRFDSCI
jgi:hypothetical protein